MNTLCENCDARCRLGICKGKEGNFIYCYRKVGSVESAAKSITPFNTLEELIQNADKEEFDFIKKRYPYNATLR